MGFVLFCFVLKQLCRRNKILKQPSSALVLAMMSLLFLRVLVWSGQYAKTHKITCVLKLKNMRVNIKSYFLQFSEAVDACFRTRRYGRPHSVDSNTRNPFHSCSDSSAFTSIHCLDENFSFSLIDRFSMSGLTHWCFT